MNAGRLLTCVALACAGLMAAAATASATSVPQPTDDAVFDGGYAYWPEIGEQAAAQTSTGDGESKPVKKVVVATVVQYNLATGERRVLVTLPSHWKTTIRGLVARGGRIAFTAKTYSKSSKTPTLRREISRAYSMALTDAVPTLLETQTTIFHGKLKWKGKQGKRYQEFVIKNFCGYDVETEDISEAGVTLVSRSFSRSPKPCKRGKSKSKQGSVAGGGVYKRQAYGYAPGATTPAAYGSAPWGPIRLRFNEFFRIGQDKNMVARDLTSGALRNYAVGGWANDFVIGDDRRAVGVAEHWESKAKTPTRVMTIFPPASTEPVVTVPMTGEAVATTFCADSVLQVTKAVSGAKASIANYNKGPMTMTLYGYDGAVLNQVALPAGNELHGVGCTNRTARVATSGPAGMTITNYPL